MIDRTAEQVAAAALDGDFPRALYLLGIWMAKRSGGELLARQYDQAAVAASGEGLEHLYCPRCRQQAQEVAARKEASRGDLESGSGGEKALKGDRELAALKERQVALVHGHLEVRHPGGELLERESALSPHSPDLSPDKNTGVGKNLA